MELHINSMCRAILTRFNDERVIVSRLFYAVAWGPVAKWLIVFEPCNSWTRSTRYFNIHTNSFSSLCNLSLKSMSKDWRENGFYEKREFN